MIQTVNSEGRISLDRIKNKANFYKITECPDGTLILTPAVVMTMDELRALKASAIQAKDQRGQQVPNVGPASPITEC